jgi:DNA-binding response OmpR family regulator
MKIKILLVEDDTNLGFVISDQLRSEGYAVTLCSDGSEGFKHFNEDTFHMCIFDVMMPNMDGFTLAEKCINHNPDIPFLFLTARNQSEDKIKGLKLGADDYIVKPFEADELVLRLNNILKRTSKDTFVKNNANEIQIGNYIFHTYRLELKLGSKVQQLTERDAALITYLFQNKNQLLKRDDILKAVWKTDDYFSGRSMDVYISKLRKYFGEDANISIDSVRSIGLEFKVKA